MNNKEIYLSNEEQVYLRSIVASGIHPAKEITRARVLLMLDRSGKSDHVRYKRTAEYAGISVQAVYNMRDEFLNNHDVEAYLKRKKRETPPIKPKVDGKLEAQIIAMGLRFIWCEASSSWRQRRRFMFAKQTLHSLSRRFNTIHRFVENIFFVVLSQSIQTRTHNLSVKRSGLLFTSETIT